MKCVANLITKEIKRVSNDMAEKLVNTNDTPINNSWMYCPKCIWKEKVRDAVKATPIKPTIPASDIEATIQHKTKFKKGKKATIKKRALKQAKRERQVAA